MVQQADSGQILVVMDFAKVDLVVHNFQILHLIVYHGGNGRQYKSFIGEATESNDKWFVIWVFNYYLIPLLQDLDPWNMLDLYCDGGGHFKCAAMFLYFRSMQHYFAPRAVNSNFFVSFHVSNGCDGLAAQASVRYNKISIDLLTWSR